MKKNRGFNFSYKLAASIYGCFYTPLKFPTADYPTCHPTPNIHNFHSETYTLGHLLSLGYFLRPNLNSRWDWSRDRAVNQKYNFAKYCCCSRPDISYSG